MQRAKLNKILVEGLNAVINVGSQNHYKDVLAVYKSETKALEMVNMEMRLAAENALLKYKQEVQRNGSN